MVMITVFVKHTAGSKKHASLHVVAVRETLVKKTSS
jgi:hypothetical protein